LFVLPATAQIKLGIKGGISTYDLGLNDVLAITNNSDQFELSISDAKYGYHIGLVVQVRLGGFVLQPEIMFNSNSVDFTFEDVTNPMPGRVFTEKYQNLDIPVMLGLKAGPIRIITGPVGHYFLKSTSDLLDYESYWASQRLCQPAYHKGRQNYQKADYRNCGKENAGLKC